MYVLYKEEFGDVLHKLHKLYNVHISDFNYKFENLDPLILAERIWIPTPHHISRYLIE